MKKLFRALRTELFAADIENNYLAEQMGVSPAYISRRLNAKQPWSMEDAYFITVDILGQPVERIVELFPRGGMFYEPKRTQLKLVRRAAK